MQISGLESTGAMMAIHGFGVTDKHPDFPNMPIRGPVLVPGASSQEFVECDW
jgi:hypothetical protein